ncbi:S8 family peptidase [Rhodoferax sp.]|uniref:S8 family peptidase n=1 Tax=Rhodoferax sp. TaxID=50421 RepID=UPI00274C266D|nr:S8 family peptidase [Rhodoferax sp.]
MKSNHLCVAAILGGVFLLSSCGGGGSDDHAGAPEVRRFAKVDQARTSRLIVKIQPAGLQGQAEMLADEVAQRMGERVNLKLKAVRVGALGAHVLELPYAMALADAQAVAARLHATPGVAYAEVDARAKISMIPNDPNFSRQWALAEPEKVAGGINAVGAWDMTRGSVNVVVAVVDTGVLPHAELAGRLLPGYDFISDAVAANDGNGRDSDASDPGDWILASEAKTYGETAATPSSWHGTHAAGIIAASGNNGIGVAGIAWNTRILPVRVLGKGGGYSSDIADGIVWAAGGSVPGVPANPYPAKVINLSLGGEGACTLTYQNAINLARARGATVVVSSGNESMLASNSRPANCLGVISVAATSNTGALASYSNYGAGVTISGPGGDDGAAVLSLGDGGSQGPLRDNTLRFAMGTSMAAPAVSGVAALMLSINPNLTPDQVQSVLTYSASRFPTGTTRNCSTATCGVGIVNALSAVRAVAAGSLGDALPAPQSGWWWNELEGGRGYAIEIRNGSLFMAGFLYETTGRPTWFVSTGTMTDASNYEGSMSPYSGGQTLTGAFKTATPGASMGSVKLAFSGASRGTLTWPNGQTTPIRRFDIVPGSASLSQTGFAPEAGWWWNHAEPGRGFAIEVQGNNLFVAGFMYDEAGQPVWYVSTATMLTPSYYSGRWISYANGQAMGQPFKAPVVTNPNVGPLTISFSDTRNATMTMPNGQSIVVKRFLDYGVATPITADPPNLMRVNKILGSWALTYRIINSYTDTISLETTRESSTTPGKYYAWGLNQYDDTTLVGYDDDGAYYYMLSRHPDSATFDSFYTFTLSAGGQTVDGCYYLYYRTEVLSSCYPMAGTKTANSGARGVGQSAPATAFAMREKLMLMEHEIGSSGAARQLTGPRSANSPQQDRLRGLAKSLK